MAAIPRSYYHLLSHLPTTPKLHFLFSTCTRTTTRLPLSCTLSQPKSIGGSEVSFSVGTHLIPHPNKVERGGEDAFFVSTYSGGVIAVADGVSGWAERNVDPALFSRELMSNASSFVEEVDHDPRFLLRRAHAATFSIGSATAIIAMLERNGVLKIANVGDCGLRIIRKGQILFSTFPQEHYFDCPYQLSSEEVGQTYQDAMVQSFENCKLHSKTSSATDAANKEKSNQQPSAPNSNASRKKSAQGHKEERLPRVKSTEVVCSVELEEGDTIIMGSDGLFDNVFDHEIVSTIADNTDVVTAAKALADLARNHSVDTRFDSPYSIEARARGFDVPSWKKALGVKLTGGKLDDITVIVAQVRRSDAKVVSS